MILIKKIEKSIANKRLKILVAVFNIFNYSNLATATLNIVSATLLKCCKLI